jgi:hypothetical protein
LGPVVRSFIRFSKYNGTVLSFVTKTYLRPSAVKTFLSVFIGRGPPLHLEGMCICGSFSFISSPESNHLGRKIPLGTGFMGNWRFLAVKALVLAV